MSDNLAPPSARKPLILAAIGVLILVGGFGTWAVTSQIAGAVISSGRVEVEQNRQIVQHPYGGVIQEILVEEGEVVEAGDVLISLDSTELTSELVIVRGQLLEIMARTARLRAERDQEDLITFPQDLLDMMHIPEVQDLVEGQRNLFYARLTSLEGEREQLHRRIEQAEWQVEGIDAQLAALAKQNEFIAEELAGQQRLLDLGLAQANRVLALQREEARLAGLIGELTADRAEVLGRVTEIEVSLLHLDSQRREAAITQLRDMEFNRVELSERTRSLEEQLNRLDIRAPVAGVVYGLAFTAPRAVIRPADPIMYVVPQDRPLVISAQVDPIHIDQLHLGQEVALRFSSLDMRTTPEVYGSVNRISADAFVDQGTGATYYQTEITLLPGEIDKLNGQPIIPGMPVEAFLQTDTRTPVAYLTKPFTDYFRRAMREG